LPVEAPLTWLVNLDFRHCPPECYARGSGPGGVAAYSCGCIPVEEYAWRVISTWSAMQLQRV